MSSANADYWTVPGINPAWGAYTSEEPPMTMQIGMIGIDGIVIASDTKQTRTPVPDVCAKRYGFGSSKIGISEDKRIAVTAAMNMKYACQAACAIMSGLKDDIHIREMYSDYTLKIEEAGTGAFSGKFNVQCIAGFADPEPALYRFTSLMGEAQETETKCQKILDRIPAGDVTNAAVFWSERYYKRIRVRQLIRLAAHLVVEAAQLNNGGVEGLEIVYCDASTAGFRRMTLAENRDLEAEAKKKGERIGKLILGRSAL